MVKQGGAGSGRHKTVGDAIDAWNDKARAKMHPRKETNPKGAPHDKWSDCVHKVGRRGGPYNPYAVCGASVHRTGECNQAKLPFQEVYEAQFRKECATGSGSPGQALTRAGVK